MSRLTSASAALLIACGIILRLAFLGVDSFWLDEAYSVRAVLQQDTVQDVWKKTLDPNHPPLWFVLLWMALRFGGTSEAVARFPSALASACGLALLFVLARRLDMSKRAAVFAVLLLSLAPLDIWYAQEARMYALVTTSALAFATALTFRSWLGAALAAAVLTVGLYVDFTMMPLAAALAALWVVWWRRTDRRPVALLRLVLMLIAAGLAFKPQWTQFAEVLQRIDTVPLLVNLREWFGLRISTGVPAMVITIAIAAGAAIAVEITWRWRQRPGSSVWWGWVVWGAFVTSTVLFMVPRGYSAKQFLATGWPFVVLVVAWALSDSEPIGRETTFRRWRLPIAVAISFFAAIVTVITPRADWRGIVAYLNERAPRTQAVLIDPSWNSIPYDYYRPRIAPASNPLESAEGSSDYDREVCLVAERFGAAPPTSPTEASLDRRFRLVEAVSFARLEVRCYAN